MRVLDLFSGIGGFSLGLEKTGGFKTVAFCEIDPFCQKILAKHWPEVPIYDDVRTLSGVDADVIVGGYPCQPFSSAGLRTGAEDDRHLWPEMRRIIGHVRPKWVVAENVIGHVSLGLDQVLSDLENLEYAWWAFVIPACAVDAPHRRDRVWVIGRINREDGGFADVANSKCVRQPGSGEFVYSGNTASAKDWQANQFIDVRQCRKWKPEPGMGRVADGVPRRMDRLRALGNAVVPQIPEIIGRAILAADSA